MSGEINFNDRHGSWIMKLSNGKVFFNRENWPEAEPDDFAKAVIMLLEKASIVMDNWPKNSCTNDLVEK